MDSRGRVCYQRGIPRLVLVVSVSTFHCVICQLDNKSQVQGMNSFGVKIVFARIKEGRHQLIALNAALRQAFEAAGFDCEDRYTPHVTVMKVRRRKPAG